MNSRGLMRFLMMFGPMIYRGITKLMNQRKQQQSMQQHPAPEQNRNQDQGYQDFEEVEDPIQQEKPPTYKEDDLV